MAATRIVINIIIYFYIILLHTAIQFPLNICLTGTFISLRSNFGAPLVKNMTWLLKWNLLNIWPQGLMRRGSLDKIIISNFTI